MLDRPVLVTGTPRSGKSGVARSLGMTREFLYFDEPLMIWNLGARRSPLDTREADEALPRVCEAIHRECQKQIEAAGKTRYVDDLSYHALRLGFVHRVLPDVRIIRCTRSAEDILPEMVAGWTHRFSPTEILKKRSKGIVLSSIPRLAWRFATNYLSTRLRGTSTRWGPQVEGLAEFARKNGPVAGAAYQWVAMMEQFTRDLEQIPQAQKLLVRYEELIADPRGQLERIGRFCEVQDLADLQEKGSAFLNPHHVGPWADISQEDWERILPMIEPVHQREGYPPLPKTSPRCALRHRMEAESAPTS